MQGPAGKPDARLYYTPLETIRLPYKKSGLKKVKLSLCLTKHYAMKTYVRVDV
jgi:hypothetical protein